LFRPGTDRVACEANEETMFLFAVAECKKSCSLRPRPIFCGGNIGFTA